MDGSIHKPMVAGLESDLVAVPPLVDPFGRSIRYLRVSVTDRCDFRCVYCMSETMEFLPRNELLSLEELERLCTVFIEQGVKKLRLTGGEPLVRRDIMTLIERLGQRIKPGQLEELTLTTNGSQLQKFAEPLFAAGVRRINVSLDSLRADRFKAITRRGDLDQVLDGIFAAKAAGIKIKLNTVALKGVNDDEFDAMIRFCGEHGFDQTFIEVMPMGEVDGDRYDQYLSLAEVEARLRQSWHLTPLPDRTGGPARYLRVAETGGRIGLITPLSHNFCESCNRVRVTCTGTLYMCLGQNDAADLRTPLRSSSDNQPLIAAIREAIDRKPKGHDFMIDRQNRPAAVARHMSVTGG